MTEEEKVRALLNSDLPIREKLPILAEMLERARLMFARGISPLPKNKPKTLKFRRYEPFKKEAV